MENEFLPAFLMILSCCMIIEKRKKFNTILKPLSSPQALAD
jgi:hypothetical protein